MSAHNDVGEEACTALTHRVYTKYRVYETALTSTDHAPGHRLSYMVAPGIEVGAAASVSLREWPMGDHVIVSRDGCLSTWDALASTGTLV